MGGHPVKVLTAQYHQNGISGRGFTVAVVRDPLPDAEGDFLYVEFDDHGGPSDYSVAVLRVSDVAAHTFDPFTDGAAWRGDRMYHACHLAVATKLEQEYAERELALVELRQREDSR